MTGCCAPRPGADSNQQWQPSVNKVDPPELSWAAPESEVRERARHTVAIPAGAFLMGTTDPDAHVADGETPVRERYVEEFRIDPICVTNEEFAAFVRATGYQSEAEELGWSCVFMGLLTPELRNQSPTMPGTPWWRAVSGASWHHPFGPDGANASTLADHPVVHISVRDAEAFATWCGMRLPQEVEWEKAARGGLEQQRFPWGNELEPDNTHAMNVWQGLFPTMNTQADGYLGTAPAKSFPPNGYGLYNITGNVWEWTASTFSQEHPTLVDDPSPTDRAIRGGSYLCHESYCNRYRVSARQRSPRDSGAGNLGFRLAV